jgi:arginine deiminase
MPKISSRVLVRPISLDMTSKVSGSASRSLILREVRVIDLAGEAHIKAEIAQTNAISRPPLINGTLSPPV